MTWAMFYLTCFLVGVTLSVLSFLSGSLHLPHLHVHLPHAQMGHAGAAHGGASGTHSGEVSVFNFGTLCAFLAWFGGTGYLLTRYSPLAFAAIVLLATVAGIAGAAVVFWFIAKVLLAHEQELDPADYERVGALGHVISSIREGGTGEIIFSLAGARHTCGARSEDGAALTKGTEVVITRYEHGIAYVRRWDELAGETAVGSG